jgi:hypothetical protein
MKHGDKAKAKSAKAASKTSVKGGKAAASKAGSKAGANLKSTKQEPSKVSAAKNAAPPAGGNGKTKGRSDADNSGFSNPLVAAAFKRAVKKFPTAFRRLTDG